MSSRHFHQKERIEATVMSNRHVIPAGYEVNPSNLTPVFKLDLDIDEVSFSLHRHNKNTGSVGVAVTCNEVWSLVDGNTKKRKKSRKSLKTSSLVEGVGV